MDIKSFPAPPRWAVGLLAVLLPLLIIGGSIVATRLDKSQTANERQYRQLLNQFQSDPNTFRAAYMTIVDGARSRRDFLTAIAVLKSAALAEPKNAFIFELLGDVYQDASDYPAAEASYRRAILDDAGAVVVYLKISDLLWAHARDRGGEIETLLMQGIRASNHLNLHKRLARYYTDTAMRAKALSEWRTILKAEPSNTSIQEEIRTLESHT